MTRQVTPPLAMSLHVTPATVTRFTLRTLGALDLTDSDGRQLRTVLAQPKRLALLVYLASARAGEWVRRDTLLALFWPELDGSNARAALRQAVRFLRVALGSDALEGRGDDELRLAAGLVSHDATAFDAAVRACDRVAALDLYRGDFLAGFYVVGGGAALEQWIDDARDARRRAVVDAAEWLAERYADEGRMDDAVRVARRAVSLAPLGEPSHRLLITLLDAAGDTAGAFEAYEALVRRLEREFGTVPDKETRALVDTLRRRGERAAARQSAVVPNDDSLSTTRDTEAHSLYLRGRWHWTRRPRETRKGLAYFEQAVARDPSFALAHAAIADAYNTLGSWEASELPSWEAFPRAHAAARKALELDASLAEAHTALAYAEMHYTWRRDVAGQEFDRALALNPSYEHAHHWHSHLLMASGRIDESLEASRRALACDPIDPVLNVHLAWHHWLAREPEAAIEQGRRTLDLHPGDQWAPFFTGLAELLRGNDAAAIDALRTAVERSGDSAVMHAALGHALAVTGDTPRARVVLDTLERTAADRRVLAYEIAVVHAALGDADQAFAWLDRAYEERSAWLVYAAVEPRLDVLRGDARFAELLRALRLERLR